MHNQEVDIDKMIPQIVGNLRTLASLPPAMSPWAVDHAGKIDKLEVTISLPVLQLDIEGVRRHLEDNSVSIRDVVQLAGDKQVHHQIHDVSADRAVVYARSIGDLVIQVVPNFEFDSLAMRIDYALTRLDQLDIPEDPYTLSLVEYPPYDILGLCLVDKEDPHTEILFEVPASIRDRKNVRQRVVPLTPSQFLHSAFDVIKAS